jgi:hypothetical protein
MQNLEIIKLQKIENTDAEFLALGIVAFQLIKVTINFYGKLIQDTLDTKIMADGSQIVIDGNGYIKAGYQL